MTTNGERKREIKRDIERKDIDKRQMITEREIERHKTGRERLK